MVTKDSEFHVNAAIFQRAAQRRAQWVYARDRSPAGVRKALREGILAGWLAVKEGKV